MFKKSIGTRRSGRTGFQSAGVGTGDAAKSETTDAELHLITVVPGYGNALVAGYFSEEEHSKAVKKVAKQLKQFAADKLPARVKPVLKVYEGSPAESILPSYQT